MRNGGRWLAEAVGVLQVLPALLLFWYALAGGGAWLFGAFAAFLVALSGRWLAPVTLTGVSWSGLVRFVFYFLHRSLLGGVDVAWRALHPAMPLEVRETSHPLGFESSQARALFVATLSLLPGTLSCDIVDERLRVHSIAGDPSHELELLQARVDAVFREPGRAQGVRR
jgi:multicomponent Na+:H+ antiporter subunit E